MDPIREGLNTGQSAFSPPAGPSNLHEKGGHGTPPPGHIYPISCRRRSLRPFSGLTRPLARTSETGPFARYRHVFARYRHVFRRGGTAPADSDHDGMPNAWETARGLDNGWPTLEPGSPPMLPVPS